MSDLDPSSLEAEQDPSTPAAHHLSRWNRFFYGSDGLRAGWRALLFVCIVAAVATLLGTVAHLFVDMRAPDSQHPMRPATALLSEIVSLVAVAAGTLGMSRFEGRRIGSYGYEGRARVPRFFWGCLWGFVAVSVLVGALWRAHWLAFSHLLLHGPAVWGYGLVWLCVFLIVALFEESLLRGYLQATLTKGMGFWPAALTLSLLFGAMHGTNKGESPVGLFSAGAVGLVFCLSLWYTRSLWWAIGFHATWDWGQSFLYGTADSGAVSQGRLLASQSTGPLLWGGGPTGPEGSLLIVPLLLLIAVAMWLWWGRRGLAPARTPYQP